MSASDGGEDGNGDDLPPTLQQGVADPTQTQDIRRDWIQQFNQRWQEVKQALQQSFQQGRFQPSQQPGAQQSGLQQQFPVLAAGAVGGPAYILAQFAQWFRDLLETTVLSALVLSAVILGRHWTGQFLRRVAIHALGLADDDLRDEGYDVPDTDPEAAIFTDPYQDILAESYVATYLDTEAAIEATHTEVVRELREQIEGEGGVVDDLTERVEKTGENRTSAIVSTRTVDLVNDMLVARYAQAGVEEVTVQAEARWQTAEDEHVCQQCKPYHGETYTIQQIASGNAPNLPRHPFCRCIWKIIQRS